MFFLVRMFAMGVLCWNVYKEAGPWTAGAVVFFSFAFEVQFYLIRKVARAAASKQGIHKYFDVF